MIFSRINILFFLLFCNIFLGWAFQILTIVNIPINYIFLILLLMLTINKKTINNLKTIKLYNILFFFIIFNLIKLFNDFFLYGLIAIRDATFFIDHIYILITLGIFVADEDLIKLNNILKYFFYSVFIFIFCWIFKDFFISLSPTVTSPTGMKANLLFNFSTLPFITTWFSFYLFVYPQVDKPIFKYLVLIFLLFFSLIVFQRRFLYLGLIILFCISFIYQRKIVYKISIIFLVLFLILPLLSSLGITFSGKLGEVSNIAFFYNHLASSFSGYESQSDMFDISQGTANQRIEWWSLVLNNQFSDFKKLLFGSNFGVPLIDFVGYQYISIREPHNSYITIFARSGLVGFILYSILNIKLIIIYINTLKHLNEHKFYFEKQILIFLGIYIMFIYSMGLADSVIAYSFYSIPMNIFFGIVLFIHINLNKSINTDRINK